MLGYPDFMFGDDLLDDFIDRWYLKIAIDITVPHVPGSVDYCSHYEREYHVLESLNFSL